MNLIEFLDGLLGPNSARQLAHLFDASPPQISALAGTAMPIVVGGMIRGVQQQSPEEVDAFLQSRDPRVLDDPSWLGGIETAQPWIDTGRAELHRLWGEDSAAVLQFAADAAGLDRERADRVMGLLTCVVHSFMARQLTRHLGLSGEQARQFLLKQRNVLARTAPAGLLQAMNWTDESQPAAASAAEEAPAPAPLAEDAAAEEVVTQQAAADEAADEDAVGGDDPAVEQEAAAEAAPQDETFAGWTAAPARGLASQREAEQAEAGRGEALESRPSQTQAAPWPGRPAGGSSGWLPRFLGASVVAGLAWAIWQYGPSWFGNQTADSANDRLSSPPLAIGDLSLSPADPDTPGGLESSGPSSPQQPLGGEDATFPGAGSEPPGAATTHDDWRPAADLPPAGLSFDEASAELRQTVAELIETIAAAPQATEAEAAGSRILDLAGRLEDLHSQLAPWTAASQAEWDAAIDDLKLRIRREALPELRSPETRQRLYDPLLRFSSALKALKFAP